MQTRLRHENRGHRRYPRSTGQIRKFVKQRGDDGGDTGFRGKNDGFKMTRLHLEN
jgi:hypothetical protein